MSLPLLGRRMVKKPWATAFLLLGCVALLSALFVHLLTLAPPSARTFRFHELHGAEVWAPQDVYCDVIWIVRHTDKDFHSGIIHRRAFVLNTRDRGELCSPELGYSDLTLWVTPAEATALEEAQSRWKLAAVFRPPEERKTARQRMREVLVKQAFHLDDLVRLIRGK